MPPRDYESAPATDGLGIPAIIEGLAGDLEKLRKGEISAVVRVVGKPVDYFSKIPANSGLHFLAIPGKKVFDDIYALAELTNADYPTMHHTDTIDCHTIIDGSIDLILDDEGKQLGVLDTPKTTRLRNHGILSESAFSSPSHCTSASSESIACWNAQSFVGPRSP